MTDLHHEPFSVTAHTNYGCTHIAKKRLDNREKFFVTADKNAQGSGDGGRLGLDDGSVGKLSAFFLYLVGNFYRHRRVYCAHINTYLALFYIGHKLAVNRSYMLGFRNHGNHKITALNYLNRAFARYCTESGKLLDLLSVDIEAINGIVMFFDDVFTHGLAHDAESDKAYFHNLPYPYSVIVLSHAL